MQSYQPCRCACNKLTPVCTPEDTVDLSLWVEVATRHPTRQVQVIRPRILHLEQRLVLVIQMAYLACDSEC